MKTTRLIFGEYFQAFETNKICGCVLFWMPRYNSTKVCSFWNQFNCVKQVESSLHNANLTTKCLPVCDSITYDAEISISKIEMKALRQFVPDGFRIIKIAVLFKDQQYFASLRSELYGTMVCTTHLFRYRRQFQLHVSIECFV